ncbi:TetR/AcrR family transcriptional regulator [Nitrincola sp. MINF-07-Sa-05]|uniref:TetR/AcrR family transcriptional regulator n=1 Tax=Nitrincola salilacus TaxID=3400273 RepID=UPI00391818C2
MARGRPSKKELILKMARELFAELGYQGTSIELVVQRAGVSKPTVYNNFPTKQVLFEEVAAQLLQEMEASRALLSSTYQDDQVGGLMAAFRLIASQSDHLTVYRIALGESHKLKEARRLTDAYEQSLISWCCEWLQAHGKLDENLHFITIALCREAILIPVLFERAESLSADAEVELRLRLNSIFGLYLEAARE